MIDKTNFPDEMTGGEAIARMLQAFGAGPMFGMGGFQLLPFYDATRRLGLDHNLINDERCAVFAADAYAKVTGRVGIADATLGPGATNLVTGLVEALNAGSPMVVIVGDAHRDHAGKNMTQETDQVAILRPACKALLRVESTARIPELVARAFAIATSGRPGPVVVDVPEDVCHGTHDFAPADFEVPAIHEAAPAIRCRPAQADLDAAVAKLSAAKRPLMLCGGGVHISRATASVEALARRLNLPVAHTMTGKGAIACTDPLSAGLFGRYDRIANDLIAASDCLFVVGCKLGEIATKRYSVPEGGADIIHLDNVPEEFDRTLTPGLRLWGDVRETLDAMVPMFDGDFADRQQGYAAEVADKMGKWRESVADKLTSDDTPVGMARLLNTLNELLPADATLVADGGFAAHWGGLLYDTKQPGRGFVPDRGFASIGYGLPGAMGAALAVRRDGGGPVVALTGDGGFNMVMGELETAIRMDLDLTVIVVNNAASGYVKALQHLMYGTDAYQASDLREMDYAKIASAMGAHGQRVEGPDTLAEAISAATTHRGPSVIDVIVTRDPAKMLPGVDNRTVKVKKGDRVA